MFSKNRETEKHSSEWLSFTSKYSTHLAINTCANGDFLKWQEVLDQSVEDVWTFLDFKVAESKAEAAEFKFKNNNKK